MKDQVVVQTRPKLALGADYMNQPFYSASDIIDALTNEALVLLYSGPITALNTLINDHSVRACTQRNE